MKLRVNILDIPKLDRLIEQNKFLQKYLEEGSGEWLVLTENTKHIAEIKRLLSSRRIKFKIV